MKFVPKKVSRTVARSALKTQKHSPTLLWGVGVVSFGATIVFATKAAQKLGPVLDKTQSDLAGIDDAEIITDDEKNKIKTRVLLDGGLELGKLYAPTIICATISLGCFTQSNRILNRRNAALAIYAGQLEYAIREYRKRVTSEIGADREREVWSSTRDVEIVETTSKGERVTNIKRHGDSPLSPYAVLFDENNPNWQESTDFRFLILKAKQTYMNKLLNTRGHVLLCDVLDELDIPRTPASTKVGWLREPDGVEKISFGFMDPEREDRFLDFIMGRENAIWLDFNVDGEIWRKI